MAESIQWKFKHDCDEDDQDEYLSDFENHEQFLACTKTMFPGFLTFVHRNLWDAFKRLRNTGYAPADIMQNWHMAYQNHIYEHYLEGEKDDELFLEAIKKASVSMLRDSKEVEAVDEQSDETDIKPSVCFKDHRLTPQGLYDKLKVIAGRISIVIEGLRSIKDSHPALESGALAVLDDAYTSLGWTYGQIITGEDKRAPEANAATQTPEA